MKTKKSLPARLYRTTADAIEPFLPRRLVTPAHYLSRRLTGRLEAEYATIVSMTNPGKTVVDVGANIGVYTYGFLMRGANVVAVEPQAACAALIRAFYHGGFPHLRRRGSLDIRVEALGAESGSAVLRVPLRDGKLDDESASLRPQGGEFVDIEVPIRRLDDYRLDNVQIIKIDVEGHEVAALTGGRDTIRRWKPAILVEIEQRHHSDPITEVFAEIAEIVGPGYQISFLGKDGRLLPISEFEVSRHQLALVENPLQRDYVRNFFILQG